MFSETYFGSLLFRTKLEEFFPKVLIKDIFKILMGKQRNYIRFVFAAAIFCD